MIKIIFSKTSGEAEISATPSEFSKLKNEINSFLKSQNTELQIRSDCSVTPAPYEYTLEQLKIKIGSGSNLISGSEKELTIVGSYKCLQNFAGNIPIGGEANSHVHYDYA